eukprot:CAMPEP_0113872814 /NCGR_PEP_ID=MMETSP0780_2-20120614/3424_1 /TAXON_ID=652834 /ORGANISM="Palpitomonas bilix" /LENGTH=977 /DNA_ID=CAMNT_0000858391 /DNA_START=45 /DNA_END=2974 /DNA_ORIENTATION=- /assembly_acc=CAM_ASM_000599
MAMRGLTVLISDIRQCANKEEEKVRVDKELAHIRGKFRDSNKLSSYQKKKYVWKMLYIYMLGYDIDFGHMEAIQLISSTVFSEKQVGYLAITLLLNEHHDFLRLVINSVRNDIVMNRDENVNSLALTAVANVGGREFAEAMSSDVHKVLTSTKTPAVVKKKAALCLLHLFRRYPDMVDEEGWKNKIIAMLEVKDLGVVQTVASLLLGLIASNPPAYTSAVSRCCRLLAKLVLPAHKREFTNDYFYQSVFNPWLQVKLLRILQYFDKPEGVDYTRLNDVLKKVFKETQMHRNVNKNNVTHAILFEAVNLVIHIDDQDHIDEVASILGRFISSREANYRYLGLDSMGKLAQLSGSNEQIKKHQGTIVACLKDRDISIRKRALDLLYNMCDETNSQEIVFELLSYLTSAHHEIREDLVLKIAILAERFPTNLKWYVDVVLQLISLAGDYVSEEIWHRIVQIVTNEESVQAYAAETVYKGLQSRRVHETMVRIGGYVIGEFGHLVADQPGSSPAEQFELLQSKFTDTSLTTETRSILLTAYMKLANLYPELKAGISEIFSQIASSMNAELQQRAAEYLKMTTWAGDSEIIATVWDMMPAFPERESGLLKKIKEKATATADRSAAEAKAAAKKEEEEGEGEDEEGEEPASLPVPESRTRAAPAAAAAGGADLLDLGGEGESSTPAPAPAPASTGGGLDDLLGGLSMETPAAAPAPAASSSSGGGLDDLLGGFDSAPAAAAPAAAPHVGAGEERVLAENFLSQQEGLLYESSQVQIFLKMQFAGNKARGAITFKNPTPGQHDNFKCFIPSLPFMRVDVQGGAPSIFAHGDVTLNFQAECLQPSNDIPSLQFAFTAAGENVKKTVKFPLYLSKFIEPANNVPAPTFFGMWKQYSAPGMEFQTTFQSPLASNRGEIISRITNLVKMSSLDGVDQNAQNIVGAAQISAGGGKCACMIRVELAPAQNAVRLTLRTAHAMATSSLKSA